MALRVHGVTSLDSATTIKRFSLQETQNHFGKLGNGLEKPSCDPKNVLRKRGEFKIIDWHHHDEDSIPEPMINLKRQEKEKKMSRETVPQ